MPSDNTKPPRRDTLVRGRSRAQNPSARGVYIPDWAKMTATLVVAIISVSWIMFEVFIDRSVVPQMQQIDKKVGALESDLSNLNDEMTDVKTNMTGLSRDVHYLTRDAGRLAKEYDELSGNVDELGRDVGELSDNVGRLTTNLDLLLKGGKLGTSDVGAGATLASHEHQAKGHQ